MKAKLWTLILLFVLNNVAAHTCVNEKVRCPLDGTKVTFCVTASMTTMGAFLDFQKKGAIGDHYEQLINTCPKCHFSGYVDDFKTVLKQEEKESLKSFLPKFDGVKIDDSVQCKIAAEIKELLKASNKKIMACYQVGAFLLRGEKKRVEERKEMQRKTKEYLIKALGNNEYEIDVIANINYLIGEMSRRTGDFEKAIEYYNIAIADPNKQEGIEKIANEQKQLAENKDENNDI